MATASSGALLHIIAPASLQLTEMDFRALSEQQEGSEEGHLDIRQTIVDFMRDNEADFCAFIDEDEQTFEDYRE